MELLSRYRGSLKSGVSGNMVLNWFWIPTKSLIQETIINLALKGFLDFKIHTYLEIHCVFFSPKTVYSKNLLYIVVAHTQTTKSRTNCMYMLCNYSYLLKSKFLSANMGVLLIFLPHTIMEYLWPFMTKLFSMNENFCYQFLFPIISNSDAITYCEYSLFLLLLSKRKIDYEN